MPEVVLHGQTGLVVPTDPRALAEAVGRLLDDPALTAALGEQARRHVTRTFSMQGFLTGHADLYEGLVERVGN